jgi:hypothetical protein
MKASDGPWGCPRPADNAIQDDTTLITSLQLPTFSLGSTVFTPTEERIAAS